MKEFENLVYLNFKSRQAGLRRAQGCQSAQPKPQSQATRIKRSEFGPIFLLRLSGCQKYLN